MPGLKRVRVRDAPRNYKRTKKPFYSKSPIARLLSSMSEQKYIDTVQTTTDYNSTYPSGLAYSLCQLAEGNDFNNRQGRAVKMKYVMVDLFCFMDAGASPTTAIPFTVHIVLDKQPNSATATYGNIMDLTVTTNGFQAFKNIATNSERFRILKTIGSTIDLNAHGPYRERFFVRIPEEFSVARYAGTTASVPQVNNILLALSASATTVGDGYYSFSTRVVYTDN